MTSQRKGISPWKALRAYHDSELDTKRHVPQVDLQGCLEFGFPLEADLSILLSYVLPIVTYSVLLVEKYAI